MLPSDITKQIKSKEMWEANKETHINKKLKKQPNSQKYNKTTSNINCKNIEGTSQLAKNSVN
jgi:hypothetical protein